MSPCHHNPHVQSWKIVSSKNQNGRFMLSQNENPSQTIAGMNFLYCGYSHSKFPRLRVAAFHTGGNKMNPNWLGTEADSLKS